ncbi:hypothetical protein KI387_004117, partial [Taxus chinensis]
SLNNHSREESDSSEEQHKLDLGRFDELLYYNRDKVLVRVLELGATLPQERKVETKIVNHKMEEKPSLLDMDNPFDIG